MTASVSRSLQRSGCSLKSWSVYFPQLTFLPSHPNHYFVNSLFLRRQAGSVWMYHSILDSWLPQAGIDGSRFVPVEAQQWKCRLLPPCLRGHRELLLLRGVCQVRPPRRAAGEAESVQKSRILQILFPPRERNAHGSLSGLSKFWLAAWNPECFHLSLVWAVQLLSRVRLFVMPGL